MCSRIAIRLFFACLIGAAFCSDSTADQLQNGEPIDFEKSVLPILEAKCNRCHGEKSRKGKLDMRTPELMLKGGNTGPAFVPGNSQKSLMIELMHYQEMPPKKVEPRVTAAEFDLLKAWIDALEPPPQ